MPEKDPVAEAIQESTKATNQITRRMDSLERDFRQMEATVNQRMGNLETEMGSMNAHLDNINREAQITNALLREEMEDAREDTRRRQKLEDEEREHRRKREEDARNTYKQMGVELWGMFKQPLGYLTAGVVAWVLYSYFSVPDADKNEGSPTTQGTQDGN